MTTPPLAGVATDPLLAWRARFPSVEGVLMDGMRKLLEAK